MRAVLISVSNGPRAGSVLQTSSPAMWDHSVTLSKFSKYLKGVTDLNNLSLTEVVGSIIEDFKYRSRLELR